MAPDLFLFVNGKLSMLFSWNFGKKVCSQGKTDPTSELTYVSLQGPSQIIIIKKMHEWRKADWSVLLMCSMWNWLPVYIKRIEILTWTNKETNTSLPPTWIKCFGCIKGIVLKDFQASWSLFTLFKKALKSEHIELFSK